MRPSFALPVMTSLVMAAFAPQARADRLTLSDGRVVEGAVSKDGEIYRVASRFGEAQIPAKDVTAWVKGETVEAEWRRRAAALAVDDHAGRAALSKWLVEAGRVEEGSALAQAVVEADPENATAHAVLGHIRHRGSWMTPDEARISDGLVRHGDAWYTPEEWTRLDADKRAKADEADRALAVKANNVNVNAALRLMLAPDKALRAEGEKRLLAIAAQTKSKELETLATQVRDYALATDRLMAASGGGGGVAGVGGTTEIDRATVLTECRIQLAKLKRPISTLTTGLASNAGGSGVTIQLPEIELIKIGTTVAIPAR
jgi:hypothetical protein